VSRPRSAPPLGRLMSVSFWRDGSTGAADGSVVIATEFGFGTAKLRIAAEDIDDLLACVAAVAKQRGAKPGETEEKRHASA
jgi:hypothetical protein